MDNYVGKCYQGKSHKYFNYVLNNEPSCGNFKDVKESKYSFNSKPPRLIPCMNFKKKNHFLSLNHDQKTTTNRQKQRILNKVPAS